MSENTTKENVNTDGKKDTIPRKTHTKTHTNTGKRSLVLQFKTSDNDIIRHDIIRLI